MGQEIKELPEIKKALGGKKPDRLMTVYQKGQKDASI